jgi:DNA-binding HxlR family transcriptional regulator
VAEWKFLTNHTHVLVCVASEPEIRLRDIAERVGITERAAHRILSELVEDGYVRRKREGRRNSYDVRTNLPLRHSLQDGRTVGELLAALDGRPVRSTAPSQRAASSSSKKA